MITKLWQLFGYFYFLLAILIPIYFLASAKIRKLLLQGVLAVVVLVNLFYFARFLAQEPWRLGEVFQGSAKIIAKTTLGQSAYAALLQKSLPADAGGCIYWYNDTPTVFLISQLYPRRFRAIEPGETTNNCSYVISPKHD